MFQIPGQQAVSDLINRFVCFISDFSETYPYRNCTTDMISHYTRFPAPTPSDSRKLLCLTMKLLCFPASAAHLPYGRRVILSHAVCNDIVRAPGRQHNTEQFHLVIFGEIFYFQNLTMAESVIAPSDGICVSVRSDSEGIINRTVISDRTVIQFPRASGEQHHIFCRIPCIREYGTETQLPVIYAVCQHIRHMSELGFPVSVRVGNTEVGYPKSIFIGIDINTCYDSDSSDNAMRISAVLSPHRLDLMRTIFIRNGIIRNAISAGGLYDLSSDVLPYKPRCDFIIGQITVDCIMSEPSAAVCEVCKSVIYLTAEQILTIIRPCYFIFFTFFP